MTSRTILTVGALTGATLACSAMAQTVIYTCGFDNPPYNVGSIDAQQSWVTAQATALAPGLTSMAVVSSGGPGAQAGNGFFFSQNGPDSTTSGRFAFQAASTTAVPPLVAAVRAAEAGNATAIQFTAYITAPTPALSGTSNVGARHGMVLYVKDPTGVNTATKAACGFQVRAYDRQVFMVQWLDVGQLGVGTAGNYLINFTTPLLVDAAGYTQVGARWNRETGMPSISVGASGWLDVVATSTVNYSCSEFDIVNTRGSASATTGAINTVVTSAYMDSLSVAAAVPAYPQCNSSAGACDQIHASGGCNIVTCCEQVCAIQTSCCDTTWDSSCVGIAVPQCNLFVYSCDNPATPANNCATAPTVVTTLPALIAYNTTTATTDGPPEAGCNSGSGDLPIHKDVWYRFRAPANGGTLIASNCNTSTYGGTGNFDSKIAAYDLGTTLVGFDPQTLPELYIGCNEDCNDPTFASELTVGLTANHYYLVRLGGYLGESGFGNIYIGVVPPPNPCDPANVINGVAGFQTVTADALYPDLVTTTCAFTFGTQNIAKPKYIKFTPAASGTMLVQTCSDASSAATDARLAAMTSCGDASTIIACDDDGCSATTFTSKLSFPCTAGTTYYIAVGGYDAAWTGSNVEIVPPAPPACPADLNNDGQVNGADLGLLLGAWGVCSGCAADLNADGQVNGADLGLLLGAWGPCA